MLKRHWLWYATIACAVLILSGCCHDRLMLRGDWSIGLDAMPSLGGCSVLGCHTGPVGPRAEGMSPALAASENPLGATQHAKFHPVPTRPVFMPKEALPVSPAIPPATPPPARGPEPPAEELYLPAPTPAEEQVGFTERVSSEPASPGRQHGESAAWFFDPAPKPLAIQSVMVPPISVPPSQSVMVPSSVIKPASTTPPKTASTSGSASDWRPRRIR